MLVARTVWHINLEEGASVAIASGCDSLGSITLFHETQITRTCDTETPIPPQFQPLV
jgi:hypothetical protein